MGQRKNRGEGTLTSPTPGWFSPTQSAEWDRLGAILATRQKGTPQSLQQRQILEAYVVERCRWLEAEKYLQEQGEVLMLRNERGEVRAAIEAPQLKIAARAQANAIKLGGQLGLHRIMEGPTT